MKIAVNTSALTINGDMDFSDFEKLGEVKYFGELPREEIFRVCADCDAVVVNKVIVDEKFINACPRLKYVGLFATGYNLVDLPACTRRGITVCNVPGYSGAAVAQHVFALLLSWCGKTKDYIDSVKAGDWIKSPTFCYFPWPTVELLGKTFGVYGYGNIGKKVAGIAAALGMRVIVRTRTFSRECPYEQVSEDEILRESDVLSLHCPLTAQTQKLINADSISKMKNGAVLINTARGGLVDESALASALKSGKLSAALLDVVETEPMSPDNPLYRLDNCYITPHVAWVALETRRRGVKTACENLAAFIAGRPQNTVN